jgi:hypothetical protein
LRRGEWREHTSEADRASAETGHATQRSRGAQQSLTPAERRSSCVDRA